MFLYENESIKNFCNLEISLAEKHILIRRKEKLESACN